MMEDRCFSLRLAVMAHTMQDWRMLTYVDVFICLRIHMPFRRASNAPLYFFVFDPICYIIQLIHYSFFYHFLLWFLEVKVLSALSWRPRTHHVIMMRVYMFKYTCCPWFELSLNCIRTILLPPLPTPCVGTSAGNMDRLFGLRSPYL